MKKLTLEKKIDYVINKSEELGITSNQFAENIEISNMTAYNILKRRSLNPRSKNVDSMYNYIQKLLNPNDIIQEPEAQYIITDKTQLLKIAVEFAENYQRLKEFTIVKNIIEIEVLKRLIEMKQNPNHSV